MAPGLGWALSMRALFAGAKDEPRREAGIFERGPPRRGGKASSASGCDGTEVAAFLDGTIGSRLIQGGLWCLTTRAIAAIVTSRAGRAPATTAIAEVPPATIGREIRRDASRATTRMSSLPPPPAADRWVREVLREVPRRRSRRATEKARPSGRVESSGGFASTGAFAF